MTYKNSNTIDKSNDIKDLTYGSYPYGSKSFGASAQQYPCPTEAKYSGDTIYMKATPKDFNFPIK